MILHLSKIVEASSVKRIHKLLTLSMTLAFLSELVSFASLGGFFSALIFSLLWLAYYGLLFRALRKMLYSFLTLTIVGILLHSLFMAYAIYTNNQIGLFISIVNTLLMFLLVYRVSRPIFFPKINWTEYDFRYRNDRRVKILKEDEVIEVGRLYDLRRGEAALQCFNELELDQTYSLEDEDGEEIGSIKVLSQRITLLGRPITHGIKMVRS